MSKSAATTQYHDMDSWEVHLVYNQLEECPSDECLSVAAPNRETAIEEARRVSKGNPPEVGPVYNEKDMIPTEMCDNWPSVQDHVELNGDGDEC